EKESDACLRDNTHGPHNLSVACNKAGIRLISFSTDLVFDGSKNAPYVESDPVNPLNMYGNTKAQAEYLLLKNAPSSLIIRTSAFFGPWDEYNFVHYVRKSLSQYETIRVPKDIYISPTYIPHLVNASLDILIDEETGIWHLANKGSVSWSELAYDIAERFELDKTLIQPVKNEEMNYIARRPSYSVLGSEKGHMLPTLETALKEYLEKEKTEKRKVA
ncbi:MAG: SDR family oxidoreductase, partial [Flavisolibacter sp.]